MLGTCAGELYASEFPEECQVDHILWESFSHSDVPELDFSVYDAVVVSLTLRHFLFEAPSPLPDETPSDLLWPRLIGTSLLDEYLNSIDELLYNKIQNIKHIAKESTLFFLTFVEPRENLLGMLMPRFSLSNPSFFVSKINECLYKIVNKIENAYSIDVNENLNAHGRANIQDDYISHIGHASYMTDWNSSFDKERLQNSTPITKMYDTEAQLKLYAKNVCERICDSLRIIQQREIIKIIIIDLDDSLWRGIAADEDRPNWELLEGWPLGLAEALLIFKARGGLIAIASKNDEIATKNRFNSIYGGKLKLSDFVSIKINFEPKSKNISEILEETNLLSSNALFIDDNPREIDEVKAIHPDIRTLSREHYDWRRIVLSAPECQVACITSESTNRTNNIRASIARKATSNISREDWLSSLEMRQRHIIIKDSNHINFGRAFELLNKTNQFNTTGQRWTHVEIEQFFKNNGYMVCAFVQDKTVDNGLVAVALVIKNEIKQVVMSCRVFGLGVEYALGNVVSKTIFKNQDTLIAKIIDTGKNFTCHEFFSKMGYAKSDDLFIGHQPCPYPVHIRSYFNTSGSLISYENFQSDTLQENKAFICSIKNESEDIWVQDYFDINGSYHLLDKDGNIILFDGERFNVKEVILPGEIFEIIIKIENIERYKNSSFSSIDLVHENRKWFSLRSENIPIV